MIVSKSEAFQYPITSIPLALATPEGELRQSDKASFRNFLISYSDARRTASPMNTAWFIDGLSAIRSLKPKETYEEWIESILMFITPPDIAEATVIGMINDTYSQLSAKADTRKKRGENILQELMLRARSNVFHLELNGKNF